MKVTTVKHLLTLLWFCGALMTPAAAQTGLNFSGLQADQSAPLEVSADRLSLNQSDGSALFQDNVIIGQGNIRLSADQVVVRYSNGGGISRVDVQGKVTFVTADEAAEADTAIYDLDNRQLTLAGNVMVTQGQSAVLADRMVVDLATGDATLTGRVRTILQQAAQ